MKTLGIYKLNWLESGYFYIGQSIDIQNRFNRHKHLMINNKNKSGFIQSVYNKYGMPSFEILEECLYDDLNSREQHYLDLHFDDDKCCNLNKNAVSSKGHKYSKETIERMKMLRAGSQKKGKENPNYGRKASIESRKKMSEAQKGDKSNKARIVLDTESGVFYYCLKELTDLYNLNHRNMSRYLSGARKNKTIYIYA
jgi:group I intron endonuclease